MTPHEDVAADKLCFPASAAEWTAGNRRITSQLISVVVTRWRRRRDRVGRVSLYAPSAGFCSSTKPLSTSLAKASTACFGVVAFGLDDQFGSLRRSQRQQVAGCSWRRPARCGTGPRSATQTCSAVRANISAGRACNPCGIHDDNGARDRGSAHDQVSGPSATIRP